MQRSGEKNSLGLVKFDLKNKQSIYLHDTPAKALFADRRAASQPRLHSGPQCASVRGPARVRERRVATSSSEALASGDESYVKLKSEIPVRLLYHTAFWDGARVQFRPDVYGWDDDVAAAIGLVRGRAAQAAPAPARRRRAIMHKGRRTEPAPSSPSPETAVRSASPADRNSSAASLNLVIRLSNLSRTLPVEPWRCLATISFGPAVDPGHLLLPRVAKSGMVVGRAAWTATSNNPRGR